MPKFKKGAPQVIFRKKNGKKFTNTFHTRKNAAKAVVAWRAKGGKVLGTSTYFETKNGKSIWGSKSGMTQRKSLASWGTEF